RTVPGEDRGVLGGDYAAIAVVRRSRGMALAAEERSAAAYRRATQARIAEIASYLQELLGQRLTALIAGVHDPKAVGKWARGERQPQQGAEVRLRAAFQIAELLIQAEAPQTVRAWFLGMN